MVPSVASVFEEGTRTRTREEEWTGVWGVDRNFRGRGDAHYHLPRRQASISRSTKHVRSIVSHTSEALTLEVAG